MGGGGGSRHFLGDRYKICLYRLSVGHWIEGKRKVLIQSLMNASCERSNKSSGPLAIRADEWECYSDKREGYRGPSGEGDHTCRDDFKYVIFGDISPGCDDQIYSNS